MTGDLGPFSGLENILTIWKKLTQETGGVESLESYWRIRLRILLNFQFTGML